MIPFLLKRFDVYRYYFAMYIGFYMIPVWGVRSWLISETCQRFAQILFITEIETSSIWLSNHIFCLKPFSVSYLKYQNKTLIIKLVESHACDCIFFAEYFVCWCLWLKHIITFFTLQDISSFKKAVMILPYILSFIPSQSSIETWALCSNEVLPHSIVFWELL